MKRLLSLLMLVTPMFGIASEPESQPVWKRFSSMFCQGITMTTCNSEGVCKVAPSRAANNLDFRSWTIDFMNARNTERIVGKVFHRLSSGPGPEVYLNVLLTSSGDSYSFQEFKTQVVGDWKFEGFRMNMNISSSNTHLTPDANVIYYRCYPKE